MFFLIPCRPGSSMSPSPYLVSKAHSMFSISSKYFRLGLASVLPLAMSLLSGIACTKTAKDNTGVAVNKPSTPKSKLGDETTTEKLPKIAKIEGPNARVLCVRPKTVITDPRTIEDVIRLLNEMPKPVSVACLIDVLERPLHVNATSNPFSGQPATSSKSPRIFLFLGKSLLVSVVPTGAGAEVVEFGFNTDENRSDA